jgi:YD repeat-containing protein
LGAEDGPLRSSSGFGRGVVLLLPLLLCLRAPAVAQEIRYIYDDLNRLVGVVDQQGNAAEYVYDPVGNILQIRRFNVDASASLAITLVQPAQGPEGTTVELFGKGFSSTTGDNQIAFNGTVAPVTAATPGTLTTSVPPGATTGPITVTRGSDFAASPGPFTVLVPLTVTPAEAKVAPGRTQQFTASGPAVWKVNGILGGTAITGTISPTGL